MDTLEIFRSATQAIRTNKVRSVLTTLGIIIGVASVILLVSIGSGLQAFVTKEFESLGSNLVFILPGKVNIRTGGAGLAGEPKFTFDDVANLKKAGYPIVDVTAAVLKVGTIKYKDKSFSGGVLGAEETFLGLRNLELAAGRNFTKSAVERTQMVGILGSQAAKELFGDRENPLGKKVIASGAKITVIGVLKEKGGLGGSADENLYVYMPITTAKKITGQKRPLSIYVRTTSPETTALATKKIKAYFTKRGLTEDDYTVMEPKELVASISSFLGAVTAALSGIAAISLVVGGIGIANIMLVSVTERTREIGLRKAIGATSRDILVQFLAEAVMLSGLGGGIGISMGTGFSWLLRRWVETAVTPGTVLLAFGVSAAVGVISGLAPAIRASRLNPIDALRYE